MVTNSLVEYLQDETNSKQNKYEYIRRLNLNYTDLFYLLDIFKYDDAVYSLLRPFVSYEDSKTTFKIEAQKRKNKNSLKQKRIKQIRRGVSYD